MLPPADLEAELQHAYVHRYDKVVRMGAGVTTDVAGYREQHLHLRTRLHAVYLEGAAGGRSVASFAEERVRGALCQGFAVGSFAVDVWIDPSSAADERSRRELLAGIARAEQLGRTRPRDRGPARRRAAFVATVRGRVVEGAVVCDDAGASRLPLGAWIAAQR